VSVIPDIGYLWILINPTIPVKDLISLSLNNESISSLSGASGAKAAAGAAKMVRIVRLVRLLRFVKLYKQAQAVSLKFEKQRAKKMKKSNPDEGAEIPEESKVSKRLSDRTKQNVIMLVLTLVFTLFLLDIVIWNQA
jgi:hypothetical protein